MLSNFIALFQQQYIMNKIDREMDDNTDRAILKELKNKAKTIGNLISSLLLQLANIQLF